MQMIRAALMLVLFALPAAAQDAAPAPALGEILSTGAPPVTDIDAALGSAALADLKGLYAARENRPIWGDAGRLLLDRLSEPGITIGPKLRPLLDDARKRLDAGDAGADLLLTALYGATALALRPDGPKGFAAALAALQATHDPASLLRQPEPPTVEPTQVEAPKVETPPAAPETPEDVRLKAALATLRDWLLIPEGPKLMLGDSGPRVEALGRRLIASGDFQAASPGTAFDLPLKSALERFQARHGLPADGVAGAATLAALNVPAKDRQTILKRNLERQGSRNWGDRYLVVNIPAASYRLVETGRTTADGPVLLGAAAAPTPLLDGMIDRVLLRPSWRVPQRYADRYLWPRQEENALYFMENGIRVTDDGLRQVPGRTNPLGVAKLLIAGNDRIALHGSPNGSRSESAFESPERFTSLGCVALPEIGLLAKKLLAADPAWTEGRIDGALAVGGTQTVTLAQPLPVHFVYDTAWIDADGTIQFRDDVYGWDQQAPAADSNSVPEPCGS